MNDATLIFLSHLFFGTFSEKLQNGFQKNTPFQGLKLSRTVSEGSVENDRSMKTKMNKTV